MAQTKVDPRKEQRSHVVRRAPRPPQSVPTVPRARSIVSPYTLKASPIPDGKGLLSDVERRGLLIRAKWVRDHLDKAIEDLRDPEVDARWTEPWISMAWLSLWEKEESHDWITFVSCLDTAARISIANPDFPDSEIAEPPYTHGRAKFARDLFSRTYPDLAIKVNTAKLEAAVTAWRTQKKHWKAVRDAVLDFRSKKPPEAGSMKRQWREFANPQPSKRDK
jgi:hypothetical protein